MQRCGVNSPEEALFLARKISSSPGLEFEGIQAYEGHLQYDKVEKNRREGVETMEQKVGEIKQTLEKNGISVKEISGGGTGTYNITGDDTIWTEIQAGSYIFLDTVYDKIALDFKNSLTVLTTVIHKRPGFAVTDAGLKVTTVEQGLPTVKDHPELTVFGGHLSEEHATFVDGKDELSYLEKIEYIPSHCCTTVNLHDHYYCIRNGFLESIWEISGRGKSR